MNKFLKKYLKHSLIGLAFLAAFYGYMAFDYQTKIARAGTIGGTRVNQGGTGNVTVSNGSILYGSTTNNSLVELATGTEGQVLKIVSGLPAWGTDSGGISSSSVGTLISPLIANGTVAGVNATSSTTSFNVQGNAGAFSPFNVASSSGTSLFQVTQNGSVLVGTTTLQSGYKFVVDGVSYLSGGALIPNNTALSFEGSSNVTSLKTGTDGTFLFDTESAKNVKIKGTGGGGTALSYTDFSTTWWAVNSNGSVTQSGALTVSTTTGFSSFAGKLGIGTTTPEQALVIIGSTTISSLNAANCDVKSADGSLYCGTDATGAGSGNAAWTIGDGLIYNATSTDLVGIGTITPTTTLFIQGKGGVNPFAIASSTGTQLLTVTQTGRMGIGTTTPIQKLEVVSNTNGDGGIRVQNTNNGTLAASTVLVYDNAGTSRGSFFKLAAGYSAYKTLAARDFGFYNDTAGNISILNDYASGKVLLTGGANSTAGLTVHTNNNVGIGTTTPASKLDVWGDLRVATHTTPTLFVSPATSRVGIGTSTPSSALVVVGTSTVAGSLEASGSVIVNNDSSFRGKDTSGKIVALLEANGSNDAHFLANVGNGNALDAAFGGFNSDVPFSFGGECCGGGKPTSFSFETSGNTSFATNLLTVTDPNDDNALTLTDSDGSCSHNPESGSETVSCSSDENLKEDIKNAGSALAKLAQLNIKDYRIKKSGDRTVGVIAQEVQATNPEMVKTIKSGKVEFKEIPGCVAQGNDPMNCFERIETEEEVIAVEQPNPWELVKAIQELEAQVNNQADSSPAPVAAAGAGGLLLGAAIVAGIKKKSSVA